MTLDAQKQVLTPGTRVELFDFDARILGGPFLRFVSSFETTGPIKWQGNLYVAFPITAKGFELSGKGALPSPSLSLSNANNVLSAIINDIGDPIGATVTRWVTFADFLDEGATPDPNEHFPQQIFTVQRKTLQNSTVVEFALSAKMDQQGRQLPGRQINRDTCGHTYRIFIEEERNFNFSKATCPYVGQNGEQQPYFAADGTPETDPANDVCGKKLSDCKIRFPGVPLPTRAFPSVARTR